MTWKTKILGEEIEEGTLEAQYPHYARYLHSLGSYAVASTTIYE